MQSHQATSLRRYDTFFFPFSVAPARPRQGKLSKDRTDEDQLAATGKVYDIIRVFSRAPHTRAPNARRNVLL